MPGPYGCASCSATAIAEFAGNRQQVEWVCHVALRQLQLLQRRQRLRLARTQKPVEGILRLAAGLRPSPAHPRRPQGSWSYTHCSRSWPVPPAACRVVSLRHRSVRQITRLITWLCVRRAWVVDRLPSGLRHLECKQHGQKAQSSSASCAPAVPAQPSSHRSPGLHLLNLHHF